MADRFPLIVDSSAEQIQELSAGDNLDLTGSNLINANNIQTSDMNVVGVMTATKFKGDGSELDNLPAGGSSLEATASGTLADGDAVIVNTDATVSAVTQVGSGWIASLSGPETDQGYGIAIGNSGDVYISGYATSSGAGGPDLFVAKYNSSGVIQWQRTLGSNLTNESYGIAVDGSENVYVAGVHQFNSGYDILIAKYNSSGDVQWQRTLGTSAFEYHGKVALDSSGNVYISGYIQPSAGSVDVDFAVAKYNSSGTLLWQRTIGASSADYPGGIGVDGSGNVYVNGYLGTWNIAIVKYNTDGIIQWKRTLSGSDDDISQGIAVDSSGNSYIAAYTKTSGAGEQDFLIAKYDTSGNLEWQRTLGGTAQDIARTIAVDNSGNVYVTGHTQYGPAGSNDVLIAKYNSSGVIQWQNTLGGSGVDQAFGITTDNSGNIYFTGRTLSVDPSAWNILTAKLPDDGTGTGTYGIYTYATSSYSEDEGTLNNAEASSMTDSSGPFNSSSISLTPGTSNLTPSITSLASTNLTAENYIGISNGAYTDGQTATVQLIGSVDDAQSSLTPGRKYYVQGDGTLSTTADSPSVLAGTAVAATKLMIKK